MAEGQEEHSLETGDVEADDIDDNEDGEEDDEISQQMEGDSPSSERDGRQAQSACMSSRSESKPYSSVTHKCEVRDLWDGLSCAVPAFPALVCRL